MSYRRKVLVVDDDENIISAFGNFLKREGCLMVAASTNEEALKKLQDAGIDLMISDIKLEGQSGVELFKRVRAMRRSLPVILITGHQESADEKELKALGVEHLLLKPLEIEKLRATVRACFREIDRRRTARVSRAHNHTP